MITESRDQFGGTVCRFWAAMRTPCRLGLLIFCLVLSFASQTAADEIRLDQSLYIETDNEWYYFIRKPYVEALGLVGVRNDKSDLLMKLHTTTFPDSKLGYLLKSRKIFPIRMIDNNQFSFSVFGDNIVGCPQIHVQRYGIEAAPSHYEIKFIENGFTKRQFSLFQRPTIPLIIRAGDTEQTTYGDMLKSILIPIEQFRVLNDCSVYFILPNGVIKFDASEKSEALSRKDLLLIDNTRLNIIKNNFERKSKELIYMPYQEQLDFFHQQFNEE